MGFGRRVVVAARALELIPKELLEFYEFHEWRNAVAILSAAYPEQWADILAVLSEFRLLRSDIDRGEKQERFGDRSKVVIRLDDHALRPRGWAPREFATAIVVDGDRIDSPTHEVDCLKGKVALEVEWNNKTEFYDRDLNNFRRLFELHAIDVGVVITRCDELQTIFKSLGRARSFGSSTTILSKLKRKLDGGAGGGCPVLIVGMKRTLYLDDVTNPSVGSRFVRIVRVPKKRRK
jgi:Restriction endonuclease BglII